MICEQPGLSLIIHLLLLFLRATVAAAAENIGINNESSPPNLQRQLTEMQSGVDIGLCAFIAATNIESMTGYNEWSCNVDGFTTTNPCGSTSDGTGRWTGISSCSNGQPVWLHLSSVPIAGTIPSALSEMTSLISLSISSTSLEGTIPSALGNLHKLTSLDISLSVGVTGTVPSELCEISGLQTLNTAGTHVICYAECLTSVRMLAASRYMSNALASYTLTSYGDNVLPRIPGVANYHATLAIYAAVIVLFLGASAWTFRWCWRRFTLQEGYASTTASATTTAMVWEEELVDHTYYTYKNRDEEDQQVHESPWRKVKTTSAEVETELELSHSDGLSIVV